MRCLVMEERIKEVFEKTFKTEVDENFNKFSTDKWDSFAHLDLIVSLEQEFNVSFTPSEIGSISSFLDVVNVLKNK